MRSVDRLPLLAGQPHGPLHADVPALLRRVADSIADLGDVDVQDLTFRSELDDGEPWPAVTLYYHRREAGD